MTNNELRKNILKLLYERFCEHPYHSVTPKEFKDRLNVAQRELDYNMIYLEEKKLVELHKPLEGEIFVAARIAPRGIDLIEDELDFNITFSSSTAAGTADLAAVRKKMQDLLDGISGQASSDIRELLHEAVSDLVTQLCETEISYKEIKKLAEKIGQLDRNIAQKITTILKEPALTKLLVDSARRELLDS